MFLLFLPCCLCRKEVSKFRRVSVMLRYQACRVEKCVAEWECAVGTRCFSWYWSLQLPYFASCTQISSHQVQVRLQRIKYKINSAINGKWMKFIFSPSSSEFQESEFSLKRTTWRFFVGVFLFIFFLWLFSRSSKNPVAAGAKGVWKNHISHPLSWRRTSPKLGYFNTKCFATCSIAALPGLKKSKKLIRN